MNHLNFDYVPLTFISDQEEIKKQIRNTLIFIHLFERYNSPVRFEKLIEGTQYGYNASALQSGKNKFLRISDIYESKVDWETVPYCNCEDEQTYLLSKDDILIARTGGTTGKSFKIDYSPAHSIYAGYLIRVRAKQEVNPDYLYLFLHSFAYWSQIVNINERNFRPKANAENLKSLVLPDCPKDIQNDAVRISNGESVKGYENLYSEIEIVLSEYDKTQEVQRLLSDQINQLENLNKAVLIEAVQGKLVKQAPGDGSASELLKHIKAVKTKSGKKEKPLRPIRTEEIPFDIPENWIWCKLGEIIELISGQDFLPSEYSDSDIDGTPYLTGASNLEDGNVFLNRWTKNPRSIARKGDLLLTCKGSGVGKNALLSFEKAHIARQLMAIRPIICDVKYIQFIIELEIDQFRSKAKSQIPGIDRDVVLNTKVPLPILSEQKRIVAEVEKQFAKTKKLKERIIVSQQTTLQLLKALLHQAFEVKQIEEAVEKSEGKVVELRPNIVNWGNLDAEHFEKYAAHPINNIQNIDWELALMVACMKSKLGVTYGDVGLQKNVFNTNNLQSIFSKQYGFINSNFGTYSNELKVDLKRNPYLISQKVANNKEVYAVNPKYSKEILNKLSAQENKEFVQAINRMLCIYEHPFINKETDKIELYNTVLKVALDKSTTDIKVIYQGMKDWKIKQTGYKTKAEKFTKPDAGRMLKLLIEKKILK